MLSQFTRGAQRFPLPILNSMSLRRATFSGFRSPSGVRLSLLSAACCVLALFLCGMASPLQAQDTTPQLQPQSPSSSSTTPEQTQSSRRGLENRRLLTKQRREAQIITDTYTHRWEVYTGGEYMRFRPDRISITPVWAVGYWERRGISPPVWASPPTPAAIMATTPRRRSGRRQQHL